MSFKNQKDIIRICLSALGPQQSLAVLPSNYGSDCDDQLQQDTIFRYSDRESLVSCKSLRVLKSINPDNIFSKYFIDTVESFYIQYGTGTSTLQALYIFLVEECIARQPSDNMELQLYLKKMEEFESLYVSIARCISLTSDELSKEEVLGTIQECYQNEEDETSWFFNSDESNSCANSSIDQQIRLVNDISLHNNDVWGEYRLAIGLQHCLLSDYPTSTVIDGLSLPMRMAMEAVQTLWQQGHNIVENLNFHGVHNSINVMLVHDSSYNLCQVFPDSILLRVPNTTFLFIADGDSFSRVLCVGLTYVQDAFRVPSASINLSVASQCIALNSQPSVLLDPTNPCSLQFSAKALYYTQLIARLRSLEVTLLLIPRDASSVEFEDFLNSNSIAVLAVSPDQLEQAAALIGCIIVGDVLDANIAQCSHHTLHFSILSTADNNLKSDSLVKLSKLKGPDVLERTESVSVLLSAPTLSQTHALQDRFWRCVCRLKLCLTGSQLVPAGLVEALTILHLRGQDDKGKCYTRVLEKFLAIIASNAFGVPFDDFHQCLDRTIHALSHCIFSMRRERHSHEISVIECIASLSSIQKLELWKLAKFTNGDGENMNEALDVCSIKVEALRSAISAVMAIQGVWTH